MGDRLQPQAEPHQRRQREPPLQRAVERRADQPADRADGDEQAVAESFSPSRSLANSTYTDIAAPNVTLNRKIVRNSARTGGCPPQPAHRRPRSRAGDGDRSVSPRARGCGDARHEDGPGQRAHRVQHRTGSPSRTRTATRRAAVRGADWSGCSCPTGGSSRPPARPSARSSRRERRRRCRRTSRGPEEEHRHEDHRRRFTAGRDVSARPPRTRARSRSTRIDRRRRSRRSTNAPAGMPKITHGSCWRNTEAAIANGSRVDRRDEQRPGGAGAPRRRRSSSRTPPTASGSPGRARAVRAVRPSPPGPARARGAEPLAR